MRYMLDTNICIYLIAKQPARLMSRFASLTVGDAVISVVTFAELRHGVERVASEKALAEEALNTLIALLPVQSFDETAATSYGAIAAAVKDRRRNALDRMIAAHAVSLGVTLVTNNEADFAGYHTLSVENWTTD